MLVKKGCPAAKSALPAKFIGSAVLSAVERTGLCETAPSNQLESVILGATKFVVVKPGKVYSVINSVEVDQRGLTAVLTLLTGENKASIFVVTNVSVNNKPVDLKLKQ